MNTITLSGNLVADPVRKDVNGSPVVEFRLAHSRGAEKPATFVDCEAWQGWASHFRGQKGSPVVVTGELRESRWEKDGKPRSKHYIRAHEVRLLERRPEATETDDDVTNETA